MSYTDIPGYEGLYKINKKAKVISTKTKKEIIPVDNGCGYLQVGLYKDNVRKRKYIHILNWETHKGPIPPNKEIGHKNDIRHICELSNLELVTRKQNMKKALDKKRKK